MLSVSFSQQRRKILGTTDLTPTTAVYEGEKASNTSVQCILGHFKAIGHGIFRSSHTWEAMQL